MSSSNPSHGAGRERHQPLRLKGSTQKYSWGKVGGASRISAMVPGEAPDGPLAEYWLGGHPKGCSLVELPGEGWVSLADLARTHPALIGPTRHPQALPFILKVLSVDPSWGLSIQAHPDQELARKLHILDPINYPDASHKPEVGIPLTAVTLLYGFRAPADLRETFQRFPELSQIVPQPSVSAVQAARAGSELPAVRRELLSALLQAPHPAVEQVVTSIAQRFVGEESIPREIELLERLRKRYGNGDVGLLALFVLNIVTVLPGKAIYIGPNVPHAYLEGDLVECMACSDNVVRAGLTPKFKDVATLLEMLDYSCEQPPLIEPRQQQGGFSEFSLPIKEFSLSLLPYGSGDATLSPGNTAEVLLCLGREASVKTEDGVVVELHDGDALLVPAGTSPCLIQRRDAAVYRAISGASAPL